MRPCACPVPHLWCVVPAMELIVLIKCWLKNCSTLNTRTGSQSRSQTESQGMIKTLWHDYSILCSLFAAAMWTPFGSSPSLCGLISFSLHLTCSSSLIVSPHTCAPNAGLKIEEKGKSSCAHETPCLRDMLLGIVVRLEPASLLRDALSARGDGGNPEQRRSRGWIRGERRWSGPQWQR